MEIWTQYLILLRNSCSFSCDNNIVVMLKNSLSVEKDYKYLWWHDMVFVICFKII